MRALRLAAGLGLGLVLAVVLAAAAIRLGSGAALGRLGAESLAALRMLHRTAASLEALAMLWLAWLAWGTRAERPRLFYGALAAGALTIVLSIVGIAAGQEPPKPAALANVVGGLALAAAFAWMLSAESPRRRIPAALACALGALIFVQCFLGAGSSIHGAGAPALPAHGVLGVPLAVALAWFGRARAAGGAGAALVALALAVPLLGFTALQYDRSLAAALAHAAGAAALVALSAFVLGREA